jgi:hypothetical protein
MPNGVTPPPSGAGSRGLTSLRRCRRRVSNPAHQALRRFHIAHPRASDELIFEFGNGRRAIATLIAKASAESASGHCTSRGQKRLAPAPSCPLVDSVEGFACGSFPRQRQGDKPSCCLFSARLRVWLIGDPNFERAKLDRVQRYSDRSRAEARQVATPDLRGGRTGGAH